MFLQAPAVRSRSYVKVQFLILFPVQGNFPCKKIKNIAEIPLPVNIFFAIVKIKIHIAKDCFSAKKCIGPHLLSVFLRKGSRMEKGDTSQKRKASHEGVDKNTKEKSVLHASSHEDRALKSMMQFFAKELLPVLGIQEEIQEIMPTELVELSVHSYFQDFTMKKKDGNWIHMEFQSTDGGIEDLKRFRSYEAVASYQYHVEVTTYVLYSGKIKNPITEFSEGVNTYRVIPIILQDQNADTLIRELQELAKEGKSLTKSQLLQLTLCPLMGGEMPQKERIKEAYALTRKSTEVTKEELNKIETVIYTMADKFLEQTELEEVKEAMEMTRLGQMLVEDGIQKGRESGIREGEHKILKLIAKMMETGDRERISELEQNEKLVEEMYKKYQL